jgi:hypothetical protein
MHAPISSHPSLSSHARSPIQQTPPPSKLKTKTAGDDSTVPDDRWSFAVQLLQVVNLNACKHKNTKTQEQKKRDKKLNPSLRKNAYSCVRPKKEKMTTIMNPRV